MNHLNLTIKLHALRNKDVPCRFVQYVRTYVHVQDIHITNRSHGLDPQRIPQFYAAS